MPPKNKNKTAKTPSKLRGHLGDTDTSEEEFVSPPSDGGDGATDYGLEFSTSRLHISEHGQRCSTLRKTQAQQSQSETDQENQSPNLRSSTRNQRSLAGMSTQQPPTPLRAVPPARQLPNTRRRNRKQTNPQQRMYNMHREIVRLQQTPNMLIPRLSFARLVREIVLAYTNVPFFITRGAMEALQTAVEMYMTQRFQDAYLLTLHRGRATLEVRDMALVAFFCKARGDI